MYNLAEQTNPSQNGQVLSCWPKPTKMGKYICGISTWQSYSHNILIIVVYIIPVP
jgi:hypothetical protein